MSTLLVDGLERRVLRQLFPARAFVDYDGLVVIVDFDPDENAWELSADPASPEEMFVLEELTAATNDTTVTTVTKDEA